MLPLQRQNKIKDLLTERKSLTVLELMQIFGVTNETIRRDLLALEKEGFATRVHGGVYIEGGTTNEIDVSLRHTTHIIQKQKIASLCAALIQNGDSIFLDASTTAYYIAEQISSYRLTVLTSSMKIVELLSSAPGINILATGGNFDKKTLSFYGNRAMDFIGSYHVDKAFFSCRSVNFRFGVMDSNEKTADIRKLVVSQSNQSFLCIDSSKFGATSFVNICSFDDLAGIVTDSIPSPEWEDYLKKIHVNMYVHDAAPDTQPDDGQGA